MNLILTEKQIARFHSKYTKLGHDDCWIWKDDNGRNGRIYIGADLQARRVAYFIANGSFDDSLFVTNTCKNTLCVNPNHLKLITSGEIIRIRKSFRKKGKLSLNQISDILALNAAGVSRQDLAEKFNVTKDYIGKLVRGSYVRK